GEQSRAVAPVEAANARACLAKPGVVGGHGEVADDVQDMAAADRVAGDHRDDRLGRAPDLDLEVEYVEAADAPFVAVAIVAADLLVTARAEGLGAGAGQDDNGDMGVVARDVEGVAELEERPGTEGVADVGAVDRDLGNAVHRVVPDVVVLAAAHPTVQVNTPRAITSMVAMVADPLRALARRHGRRRALVDRSAGFWLSWFDLDGLAHAWARRFESLGLRPGERVAVIEPAGIRFAALLHACLRSGAAIVPISP